MRRALQPVGLVVIAAAAAVGAGIVAAWRYLFGGVDAHLSATAPRLMPAFGACADCDRGVPVTTTGRCAICGSSSVVMPWSHGAKLAIREHGRDDRKRFLRGGTPERRRA